MSKRLKKPESIEQLLNDCININKLDSKHITELIANLEEALSSGSLVQFKDKIILIKLGLGDAYTRVGNFKQAEIRYSEALASAIQSNNLSQKIHATNGICILNAIHSEYMKSIEGWLDILKEIDDPKQKADMYNNLGIAYSMSDRHREALECQYNCLKIDEELNRETQIAIDYFNLASSYMKLKQYDKSLELYSKSVSTFQKNNELRYLAFAYSNISMVYSDKKEYTKALEFANNSLEIKQKYANELEIANTIAIIGSLYKNSNDKKKALEYYNQSLAIFEKGDDLQSLAGLYIKYAHFYFDDNNQRLAKFYSLKGYELAHKNAYLQLIIESSKLLSSIYASDEDYKSAYKYESKYLDTYLKIFEDNPKILIAKSESEYYRIKTEEQAEFYRLSNIELTEKNRIISDQSDMLNNANNKLQKTNSMLKKLLSVIAHDIRGPVSTSAQALTMIKAKEFSVEETDNIIEETTVSLQNTYHMLNELLTWSNSAQQDTSVIMERIDVSKIIMEDINIYQSMANLKSITLAYTHKSECVVMVNKNYLHSILRNLIHNAIKFTHNQGHVTIQIRCTKTKAYISIVDDGIGMSNAEVKHLMSGKAKVKQGTHFEMGSGFGIGLCLDYLAQLQSNLIVKSSPNKGSRFTIVLNRP